MNPVERAARAVDRFQQRHGPAAFVFGVIKKYGDDRGGQLSALVAYYAFVTIFPLLLLLVTALALFVGPSSSLAHRIEASAFNQFPVIGSNLKGSISALHRNSVWGFLVGILGLIWGTQGAIQNAQYAMAQVWNVPNVVRPNFWVRLVRSLLLMAGLGVFLALSSAATTFSGSIHGSSILVKSGTLVLALVLNVVLFTMAYRLLTPKQVASRQLFPGLLIGGIGWTAVQFFGTLIVGHLRHTSQIYGFFSIVLTLVAWIYLGTQLFVYCAEINVVLHRRLWPRGMVQPPLTDADRRVLRDLAKQAERRPELRVHTEAVDDDHDGSKVSDGRGARSESAGSS